METTCPSVDERIRKFWYIYTMEYYSALKRNASESALTGAYYTEWSKSERERQILYINTYIWNLERRYWWSYMQGSKGDTDIKTDFWTQWEKARVGWFERIVLKHVHYHMWNRSPVQVRCRRQGAQGQCTGMTLRDKMGREVGAGFRMGDTCTPMVDSCQCMAKITTIL